MKDGGKITKLMERVGLSMLMVMSTMASGKMTRLMVLVSTAILMELNTKDTGKRTNNMEKALRPGRMVPDITAIMLVE